MTTATKKAGSKRASGVKKQSSKNPKKSKRVLVRAEREQCFWTNNGVIISTLVDLSDLLGTVDDEVFKYHVRKDKNDFADWVEFVLGDAELAHSLRSAKKPKTAKTLVVRRLKIYDV